MLPFRKILHPTDFSEPSGFAFQVACWLARDCGAKLVLVHIVTPPIIAYGEGVMPPIMEANLEEGRRKLTRLQPLYSGINVEYRVAQGDPATEILEVAQETKSDVIVMGTHGRTGLGRLLMGSVAEQVVRKASCPVLTVKTPVPRRRPVQGTPAEERPEVLEAVKS
jgi:nucleotide-binding universal stress UspA family protein